MNKDTDGKLKARTDMTLSDICADFEMFSRNQPWKRANIKYLKDSLRHKKKYLIKKYGFDIDNPPLRKKLSYPLTVEIYQILQP